MDDVLTLKGQALAHADTNGHANAHANAVPVRIEPEALELARERGMERELHQLVAKAIELFPTLAGIDARVDFAPWLHEAPVVLIAAHYWVAPGGPIENPGLEWIGWKRDHCPFEVAETFMLLPSPKEGPPED